MFLSKLSPFVISDDLLNGQVGNNNVTVLNLSSFNFFILSNTTSTAFALSPANLLLLLKN